MTTYLQVTLHPDDETLIAVTDLTTDRGSDLVRIEIGDMDTGSVKLLGTRAELRRVNQLIADGLFALPDLECSGRRYDVNPDDPSEGQDVHHDGPCPVHTDAQVSA